MKSNTKKKIETPKTPEKIGMVLKAARLRRKLTADQVGHGCNVSRSRVYQWEAGEYVFEKNLKPLAVTLGVSVRRLKAVNGSPPR